MLDLQSLPITTDQRPTTLSPQALAAFFDALQSYPDFVDGLDTGKLVYRETYGDDQLSPANIHTEIETVFGKKNLENFALDLTTHGERMAHPHMYLLGMVLGEVCESFMS